jgi:predicted transcriptional regulator
MIEAKLLWLRDFYQALANTNRLKMLFLCADQALTVTQLSERLGISYNLTSEYVNLLARRGLVTRTQHKNRTVSVRSLVTLKETGEFTQRQHGTRPASPTRSSR